MSDGEVGLSKDRKAHTTARNTDDLVIDSNNRKLERVAHLVTPEPIRSQELTVRSGIKTDSASSGGVTLVVGRSGGSLLGSGRKVEVELNVGELAVVGGTKRVEACQVHGVRVKVVTSLARDGRRVEELSDLGVVVSAQVDTLSVLVDERDVGNGILGVVRRVEHTIGKRDTSRSRVVRVLTGDGGVLHTPHKTLNGVREAKVDAVGGRVGITDSGNLLLLLLDEHITRVATHAATLSIADNGVSSPDLRGGGELESAVDVAVERERPTREGRDVARSRGIVDITDQKLGELAEGEVDSHLVVRESRSGKSDTRVTSVRKREREVKSARRKVATLKRSSNDVTSGATDISHLTDGVKTPGGDGIRGKMHLIDVLVGSIALGTKSGNTSGGTRRTELKSVQSKRVGKIIRVTDHVVITSTLRLRDGKSSPEVQEVGGELSSSKLVEADAALLNQVVHKVTSPTDSDSRSCRSTLKSVERSPSGSSGSQSRVPLSLGVRVDVVGMSSQGSVLATSVTDEVDLGSGNTKPVVDKVITSARDVGMEITTRLVGRLAGSKLNGDSAEPRTLHGIADKRGDSVATTVHILLNIGVSSQINKRSLGHFDLGNIFICTITNSW
jgi:hypothetical protein